MPQLIVVQLAIREFTEKHRGFFFGMGIRHSGQVYLPTEIQEMLKESGRISPSCRLYPPACKSYGLEAEPEAESKSWAAEKTPMESREITRNGCIEVIKIRIGLIYPRCQAVLKPNFEQLR